jgi:hypothetical protein
VITVLTSGVALGVHVPGLLLAARLRERGVPVQTIVLESLLPADKIATVVASKWAFHGDFRLALAGQRAARDPSGLIDDQTLARLWRNWREHDLHRFVTFSGYWLPVLRGFAAQQSRPIQVDLCRVDAAPMTSFRKGGEPPAGTRRVNLADVSTGTLPWTIPVNRSPAVPWGLREDRLLVHGGGWGMGTYQERARELSAHGVPLDLIVYAESDRDRAAAGVRHFMIDPRWHPWHDDGFPPFGEIRSGSPVTFTRTAACPGAFELARRARAIVSKPGAGTLLDSLWSATPLVMLEPFGRSEACNAELWEKLGFGLTFDRFRSAAFSLDLLQEMHHNLRKTAACVPDYSAELADRMKQELP